MTRKETLTGLLAEVEAGNVLAGCDWAVDCWESVAHAIMCEDAYYGSLDAAKALHEAMLPGWTMDQMNEWHANGESAGWHVCLLKYSEPQLRARAGDFDMSPARAWLIAVIKALIAQEQEA